MKTALLPLLVLSCSGFYASDTMAEYSLTISHINDHHSHLNPDEVRLNLPSGKVKVEMGGFPRVVAQIKTQEKKHKNHVKIHAGDAITGGVYFTLFKGEADAALMNTACFDIFAVGNHEFDTGDAGLKVFLDYLASGTCATTVLGANISPQVGVSPLAPKAVDDYLKRYIVKNIGTQKIGFIGLDIANKTKRSSSPDATTTFADETQTAQRYIDELKKMGVDKIVLVTHYQYRNDLLLAKKLTDIDAIVGGDSHTLLGTQLKSVGLDPKGPYPARLTNADGDLVCLVQAWQYAAVVGELTLNFDDDSGKLKSCYGKSHLLLGRQFTRDKAVLTGGDLDRVLKEVAAVDGLTIIDPDSRAQKVLDSYGVQVEKLEKTVIGQAATDLCFERIPGQGRSEICDVSKTIKHGSDITMLVAEAFRRMSLLSQVAIQNAGAVRTDIAAGDITIGDVYQLLPFDSTIVNLNMTGAEIKQTLEEGLNFALFIKDGSTGAYPYAAGLRFDVYAGQTFGQRIQHLEIRVKGSDAWVAIDPKAHYLVATNSFIANGGDGYTTMKKVFKDASRAEDTFLDYAQSFVDYVRKQGTISKLPSADYSTKSYCATDNCAKVSAR